jgi:hypothetical protein
MPSLHHPLSNDFVESESLESTTVLSKILEKEGKMKCYGVFYGGSSYSYTHITNKSVEEFASLQEAQKTFWSRTNFDPHYPCTDETAEIQITFEDPRVYGKHSMLDDTLIEFGYPDRIIRFGPRGGIIVERC